MPDYITRFRPDGARDFMVAAANYEVPVPEQNGIYGEVLFNVLEFPHLFELLAS